MNLANHSILVKHGIEIIDYSYDQWIIKSNWTCKDADSGEVLKGKDVVYLDDDMFKIIDFLGE